MLSTHLGRTLLFLARRLIDTFRAIKVNAHAPNCDPTSILVYDVKEDNIAETQLLFLHTISITMR